MESYEKRPIIDYVDLIDLYFNPIQVGESNPDRSLPESAHVAYEQLGQDFDQLCTKGPYNERISWLEDARGVKHHTMFWLSSMLPYQTATGRHCELRLMSKKKSGDDSQQPTLGIEIKMPYSPDYINLAELNTNRLVVINGLDPRPTTDRNLRTSQPGDLLDFGKIVSWFREPQQQLNK